MQTCSSMRKMFGLKNITCICHSTSTISVLSSYLSTQQKSKNLNSVHKMALSGLFRHKGDQGEDVTKNSYCMFSFRSCVCRGDWLLPPAHPKATRPGDTVHEPYGSQQSHESWHLSYMSHTTFPFI